MFLQTIFIFIYAIKLYRYENYSIAHNIFQTLFVCSLKRVISAVDNKTKADIHILRIWNFLCCLKPYVTFVPTKTVKRF